MKKVAMEFHGRPLSIEVGHVAKQANGSAYVQYGDSVVLVTAVGAPTEREGVDFFPLTVDYFERFSAAGRIPGGFFKREGRQTEREILTSRLCDRPIRPLFPEGYLRDTQIIATVFSYDKENETDTLALLGASTALHVSEIPFSGPVAAVRVGRINGKLVCNPIVSQLKESDIDMVVAASKEAIVMVEGEANEVPENEILEALMFGFESVQPLLKLQEDLRKFLGKPKWEVKAPSNDKAELLKKVQSVVQSELNETLKIKEKMPRYQKLDEIGKKLVATLVKEDAAYEEKEDDVHDTFDELVRSQIRNQIVSTQQRIDGRDTKTVRAISIDVGVLPRAHGSALFTRGETQALVTTTLGTTDDEQRIDSLAGEWRNRFMLHYNFPPYSVGEVKPLRGPARREIGHGALAHKAVSKVLPPHEKFPYTIRVISDILESHGSSSMATVCGSILSLMDAGVPIATPIAGIAMGLVKEKDQFHILSDISGDEDHIGDMDFKVAGSEKGVTAIQMDIKVTGISKEVLDKALHQAKEGRLHILENMKSALMTTRPELSQYAPRIETIQINPEKIREIIGPGGKMIRSIVEQSGAKIDVDDTGKVTIASADRTALEKAQKIIRGIVAEPELGTIYKGKVQRIMEYGAFIEILPGKDGLLHVSQIHSEEGRVQNVEDVLKEGDEIEVKVMAIDHQGKVKLSQKEVIEPGSGNFEEEGQAPRRGGRDSRGPRRPSGGRDNRPPRRDFR